MTRPILLLTLLTLTLLPTLQARRGALVRDGMSSKVAYDNPLLGQSGDITLDPDVAAITSKCPHWCVDPICWEGVRLNHGEEKICRELLGREMRKKELYVTFRSRGLAGGKRPNWMRATAVLGEYLPFFCFWTIFCICFDLVLLVCT